MTVEVILKSQELLHLSDFNNSRLEGDPNMRSKVIGTEYNRSPGSSWPVRLVLDSEVDEALIFHVSTESFLSMLPSFHLSSSSSLLFSSI